MAGRRNILAVSYMSAFSTPFISFSPWFAESCTVSLPQTVLSLVLMLLERCPVVILGRNGIAL